MQKSIFQKLVFYLYVIFCSCFIKQKSSSISMLFINVVSMKII